MRNILPITTAKVPIVKFYHVRTGLEGDISLYNTLVRTVNRLDVVYRFFPPLPPPPPLTDGLVMHPFQALHNTHLLACYAAIDWRVKILCYMMKVFAKVKQQTE